MILKLNHTKSIGNLPPEICPQESIGNPTKNPKILSKSHKNLLEIQPKSIENRGKSHKILPKLAKSIGKLAKPHDFDWFSYYYC